MQTSQLPPADELAAIKLLILDVDGVLTDGRLIYDAKGGEAKAFHVHDGHGIKKVMNAGIEVAVISGRSGPAVTTRLAELGIQHVFLGQQDKSLAFREIAEQLEIAPAAIACVGDDEPDLPIMAAARLGIAVANAHASVRAASRWCTASAGGAGAVREICDALIDARSAT